jgi:drug/metabolite transporter (DMT)-like permease
MFHSMNVKTLGVLATLGASAMWAIEPVLAKLSYATSDFLETSAVRALFVSLVAIIYILSGKKRSLRIGKKEFSAAVYVSVVGTLLADLLYFFALTRAPVINAVLIGHLQPIFIVLLGFAVLREDRLTRFDYLGILAMIVAGLLVTTRTLSNLYAFRLGSFSDLLLLVATVSWATTAIAMRKYARDVNAGVFTFYRFSIASIAFLIYLMATSSFAISNVYQILVGIVVGAGTILYYEGLKRIKAAQVSALELSTPFFAAALGLFALGERITTMQVCGMVSLFPGVYLLSKKERNSS